MSEQPKNNRVHGSIIGSRLAFAEQRWGRNGKQTLIDKMPLKDRTIADNAMLENKWFDFALLETVDRTIVDKLADGDIRVLHDLGRFCAEYTYRRLPAQLISQLPSDILKNAPRINVLFQDFGECQYEEMADDGKNKRGALLYRYDYEIPSSYCVSALGYFERLLELLGYRVLNVAETECQTYGGKVHRYVITWDANRVSEPTVPQKNTTRLAPAGATGALSSSASNNPAPSNSSNSSNSSNTTLSSSSSSSPASSSTSSLKAPAGAKTQPLSSSATTSSSTASSAVDSKDSAREKEKVAALADADRRNVSAKQNIFNWRVNLLIFLIMVTSIGGIIELALYLAHAEPVEINKDKIYSYKCVGELESAVKEFRLDKPYLRLRFGKDLNEFKMKIEDNDKDFKYNNKSMTAEYRWEVSLGEFISSDNKPYNAEQLPRKIKIYSVVEGKTKDCLCLIQE